MMYYRGSQYSFETTPKPKSNAVTLSMNTSRGPDSDYVTSVYSDASVYVTYDKSSGSFTVPHMNLHKSTYELLVASDAGPSTSPRDEHRKVCRVTVFIWHTN
jgi:hypothetical protein